MHRWHKDMEDQKLTNVMTTKRKLFCYHFHLPWDLSLFPSLTRLLLAFTTSPFSDSAWNLGVILDSNMLKKHIIKISQTAYFELKRVSSIRRFLTEDAAKTLVTSYILSWLDYWVHLILSSNISRKLSQLDYCNCLLMGTPNSVVQPH